MLGIYGAAKHAVKAYTDALRMELEHEGVPVAVSLVTPSSTDTMFFEHARNYMDVEPKPIPPVYAPDVVAGTVLHCAEARTREITIGSGGRAVGALGSAAPALTEKLLGRAAFAQQRSDRPTRGLGADNLYDFAEDGRERGPYDGMVREQSLYTAAARRPWLALAAATGAGIALALVQSLARGRGDARPAAADADDRSIVHGDTRLTDAMAAETPMAVAAPVAVPMAARRGRQDAELTRPVIAAFADLSHTSTEDSAASHLIDARLRDASSLDQAPRTRGSLADAALNETRGKTDEDWLLLG